MLARSVLNNMPLGLNLAEYIYKYLLEEDKNVLADLEAADKDMFKTIKSMEPQVYL